MSRQLILLRHAKAIWGAANEDVARELNPTGVAEAGRVGDWLKTQHIIPDIVICSTARRAVQTCEIVAKTVGLDQASIQFEQGLYLAEYSALLAMLQKLASRYHTVMLVGHNPGLEDLAIAISKTKLPRTFAGELLATANLLQFSLPDDWHHLDGQSEMMQFFRP